MVSGSTESHLILIDLTNKKVIGNLAAEALEAAGIVLNRNAVPFDPNPPFYPSGIRLGTPGVTSRGMKEPEMKKIAFWINEIISDISLIKKQLKMTFEHEKKIENRRKIINKSKIIKKTKKEVKNLCRKFPVKKIY